MKIYPIRLYSNNFKQNNTKKSQNLIYKENENFPIGYGQTNIAFCSRKSRNKKNVSLDEFQSLYNDTNRKELPILQDLPILESYGPLIFDTVKFLTSQGACIVCYNKDIDSKEIFVKNLRSFIDTDKMKRLGMERGKPFVEINLSDYSQSPENAYHYLLKDFNKQVKPSQNPIIMLEGIRALFSNLERPYDFANSSLFKKYPTIFFMDEGFNILGGDEMMNFKLGFETSDQRKNHDEAIYYNDYDFKRTVSKISFINNYPHIILQDISQEKAFDYLSNPLVQKHLLTNGHDLTFHEALIPFTLALGKGITFFEDNYYNSHQRQRLLYNDIIPINKAIFLLKLAISKKLIQHPTAKEITVNDLIEALPNNLNWFEVISKYADLEQKVQNLQKDVAKKGTEQKSVKKKKEEPKPKTETPNKEEADKKEEKTNYNFEIVKNPKTRFSDVGGMYNIKRQLKEEFIDILRNPRVKNSQKPGGIMLSGPPGCGKTLLARAIAGEANVPFLSTAGSSFIEVYVGVGPKRVRELYAVAREEASKHPSKTAIVFIDEVDAVAGNRQGGGGSEDLRTINALLHEMDGSNNKDDNNIKIVTIVATNHEGMIDSAFKRSGRIDLKYTIDDPRYSIKAREEILKIHAKELNFKDEKEKNTIIRTLAGTTAGLSGADLAELLKKANRMSLNVNRKENIVTQNDINEAKMQIKAGIKTDIEHTEYELRQTIAHEAGHAVASLIMEKVFENEENKHKMPANVLDFITNSARGNALGATYFKPSGENKMGSKETCFSDLITLYGGYAIESEMFDTHSAGVSGDLKAATELIENAVSNYDFGSEKHYLSLNSNLTKSLFQEELKQDMLNFAKNGMKISKQIIRFTKLFIKQYVDTFVENDSDRIVTSAEFKEKFYNWLESNKLKNEFEKLCCSVKSQINEFCDEKDKEKSKMGF